MRLHFKLASIVKCLLYENEKQKTANEKIYKKKNKCLRKWKNREKEFFHFPFFRRTRSTIFIIRFVFEIVVTCEHHGTKRQYFKMCGDSKILILSDVYAALSLGAKRWALDKVCCVSYIYYMYKTIISHKPCTFLTNRLPNFN